MKNRLEKTPYLDTFHTVYMHRNIQRFFFFLPDIFQHFDVHFRIIIHITVTNKLFLVLLYNKISQLGLSIITLKQINNVKKVVHIKEITKTN